MKKRTFYILVGIISVTMLMFVMREVVFFFSEENDYQSKHFYIRNYSDASHWELRNLARSLEKGREQVYHFFDMNPESDVIFVTVREGSWIPSAYGGELQMWRHHGKIYQGGIVHELAHIVSGYVSSPAINEGLAVFVDEAIHQDQLNGFPDYNQKADAWVLLFLQNVSFISLKELLEVKNFQFNMNGSSEDAYSWQVYLEGASFVRWIVQTKGWDVFWKYYHSTKPIPLLGHSVEEIEKTWVNSLKRQQLPAFSCREQLDQSQQRFQFWCDAIEKSGL